VGESVTRVIGLAVASTADEVGLTGAAVGLTGDRVGLTGAAVGLTGDAVGLTGAAVGLTGDDVCGTTGAIDGAALSRGRSVGALYRGASPQMSIPPITSTGATSEHCRPF